MNNEIEQLPEIETFYEIVKHLQCFSEDLIVNL